VFESAHPAPIHQKNEITGGSFFFFSGTSGFADSTGAGFACCG
jgi:hypothetical protein